MVVTTLLDAEAMTKEDLAHCTGPAGTRSSICGR